MTPKIIFKEKFLAEYDEDEAKLPECPPVTYQHISGYTLSLIATVAGFLMNDNVLRNPEFIIRKFSAIFFITDFIRSPFVKNQFLHFYASIGKDMDMKYKVIGILLH